MSAHFLSETCSTQGQGLHSACLPVCLPVRKLQVCWETWLFITSCHERLADKAGSGKAGRCLLTKSQIQGFPDCSGTSALSQIRIPLCTPHDRLTASPSVFPIVNRIGNHRVVMGLQHFLGSFNINL